MTREERIAAIRKNEVTIPLPVVFTEPPVERQLSAIFTWCVEQFGEKGAHPLNALRNAENLPTTAWAVRVVTPDLQDTTFTYVFWFARSEDAVFFALRWKDES